ncbi:threonine/serine exporter family protein [Acidaminobacterium chupaoyuni]
MNAYQELLDIATRIGLYLLETGAEIYRVEDSIRAITTTYGVKEVDVFAVPTCLIVTINPPDSPSMTNTKRIYSRSTDLGRIYMLNTLSRDVVREKPSFEEIERRLNEIEQAPSLSLFWQVCAYALAAFGFTLFFGGTWLDAICSLSMGAAIRLIGYGLDAFHTNSFFINTICSAATAFLAVFWYRLGVAPHIDKMVIGAMMNLVPGVAITNSVRDIIAGDLLAGQAKLTEALLAATAMALGAGLILSLNRLF